MATEELANETAFKIANYRALQQWLYCQNLTPEDLANCGNTDGQQTPEVCAGAYCDGSGNLYCDEDGVTYTSI